MILVTSVIGTFETCQPALKLSAYGGWTGSERRTVKMTRMTPSGHRPTNERGAWFRPGPSLGKMLIAVMYQSSYSIEMSWPV
jgi:hypothetical protein